MKSIILAAGLGSRLNDLTKNKPKSLVKVNGEPIIKYQIDAYINAGISDVIVVVGYKAQKLEKYLKENYDNKIKIVYNLDFKKTNNMYSLWLCEKYINDCKKLFISNADVVFDESILKKMVKQNGNLVACDPNQYNIESMKISVNSNNQLTDISKQIDINNSYACSIDLYCFQNNSIKLLYDEISNIIEFDKNQWTELAIQKIIKENKIKINPLELNKTERWFEIDNMNDLISADMLFSEINLKNKNNFIFDLDGTIYLGNSKIKGASELVKLLDSLEKKCFFVSNNSSRNKKDYLKKLDKMNISVTEDQIILSTDAAILSLKKLDYSSGFIIGNENFKEVLSKNKIYHDEINPEFILLAYDTELNYEKLKKASIFLNNDIPFYATHSDKFCPTENGPIPDAGSFISLFEATNNKSPEIFGKPNRLMLSKLFENDISLNECVFIGDRLNTDFELANNCNIDFICVLTGEANRVDIENSKKTPSLIVNSVKDLIDLLK